MILFSGNKMEVNPKGFTFRDGSHSQSHSNLEIVDSTAEPGASMDGVVEMANVDYPNSHTNEGDDLEDRQTHRGMCETWFYIFFKSILIHFKQY